MTDTHSLLLYITAFTLSALFVTFGRKRGFRPLIALGLIIPVVIAGFRFMVGTDYGTYVSMFDRYASESVGGFLTNSEAPLEVGYFLVVKLSALLGVGPAGFFVVMSLLTVILFYYGLKRYNVKNFGLIYFLFLMIAFPTTLNLVRQGVAVSAVFYAFSYISTHNIRQYLLLFLLAISFHMSSLVLLPVYFINRFIKNSDMRVGVNVVKIFAIFILILTIVPVTFTILSFLPVFEKYVRYEDVAVEANNYIFYLKFIMAAVVVIFSRTLIKSEGTNKILILFTLIDLALTMLGFVSPFVKRIGLYFSLFYLLLLSGIASSFSDKLGRRVGFILLVLYGLMFFYISFYVLGQSEIFPYSFVGEGS